MPASIKDISSLPAKTAMLPSPRSLSIADNLSALSLCCAYAREAAAEGRLLAAHHLFQGAVGYFDRVQNIVARCQQNPLGSEKLFGSPTTVHNALRVARAELDSCAQSVYFDAAQQAPITQSPGSDSQ